MKARKLKNLLFGTSVLLSGVLTSCVHTNSFTASKKEDTKDSLKKEQQYDVSQNQMLREKYYKTYADSIRSAHGYDSICNKATNLWNKSAEIVSRADSLAMENSLGNIMQGEVERKGDKILKDFLKNMSDILKSYHISLQDYLVEDNVFIWRFNTHTQEDGYDDTDYVLKQPLIYFGVNTCGVSDISGHEFDEFLAIINQIIKESNCYASQKNIIMNKINVLIQKTKPKLIASRKSIERKYADYYVVIDGQDPAFIPYGAEDWSYGYSDIEYPERQTVVKLTTTSVYGKNLTPDFFSNSKAKYKLINLGNNQWQVQKTLKNGTVETTEIFADISKPEINEYYAGNDVHNYSEFVFTPNNNGGVQITTKDFVVVKRAKRQWCPSREVLKQLDTLEEQSIELSAEAAKLEKKKKQITQYADSVANQMVNQYFQVR